jgi:hypothetical protein
MNNLTYKLKVNPNIKILLVPLLTIAVVVILFVLFAPQNITRLDKKMKDYKEAQSQELALSQKLDSLRGLSSASLDPEDISVIALPNKSPGIWVVSQVRRFTKDYEIKIEKMRLSRGRSTGDIESADISFEIKSEDYPSFLAFLNETMTILPFTSLKGVSVKRSLTVQGDVWSGSVDISFYWSDFPTTLPAIDKPLNELTIEENNLIGVISGYKKPLFTELQPDESRERPRPFE